MLIGTPSVEIATQCRTRTSRDFCCAKINIYLISLLQMSWIEQMKIDEAMPIWLHGFVSGRLKGLSNCKNAYSRLIENRLDILK
jgi:hypothetical protein